MSTQGQTVLITGASSGIGLELARCFARNYYQIIMVAHYRSKLDAAAVLLQQEFPGLRVQTIALDLSTDTAPSRLFDQVQDLGWQVDILVNNAGFGEYGPFYQSDLEKELAMIHLNVISLVHLTKLYLPYMLNRGSGKILQLGSVASFTPTPLQSVYGATKAFILSFSEALQEELKGTPVTVTVLCPPATETNFFNVAGAQDSKIAQGNLATAQEVAESGYKALMAGDARAVPTFKAKLEVATSTLLPDSVSATLMHKQSEEVKLGKKKTTAAKTTASARPKKGATIISEPGTIQTGPSAITTDPIIITPDPIIPPVTTTVITDVTPKKKTSRKKAE